MKHLSQIQKEFVKQAEKLPNEDLKIGDKVKCTDGTGIVKNILIIGEPVAEIDIDGKRKKHAIEDIKIIAQIQSEFTKLSTRVKDMNPKQRFIYNKKHKPKRYYKYLPSIITTGPSTLINKKDINDNDLYENDTIFLLKDNSKSQRGFIINGQITLESNPQSSIPITPDTKILRLTDWFINNVNDERYPNIGLPKKQKLKQLSKNLLLPRSIHALYIYDKPELRPIWKNLVKKYKLTNEKSSNKRWPFAINELKTHITNDMAKSLFDKYKQILPTQAADFLSTLAAKDPNKYFKYLSSIPRLATTGAIVASSGLAVNKVAPIIIKLIQDIYKTLLLN